MIISYTEDSDAGPAYKPLNDWDFNKAAGELQSQKIIIIKLIYVKKYLGHFSSTNVILLVVNYIHIQYSQIVGFNAYVLCAKYPFTAS